jgi:DNA-binding GntR family transcriptional regulator
MLDIEYSMQSSRDDTEVYGSLGANAGDVLRTREVFVADRLRQAILRGDLRPGEKLDQKTIADLLGVSRSPLRVALTVLAGEGLVEIHPHRGSTVAELSPEELEEVYCIRGILEGRAAGLAASKLSTERLASLQAILDELDEMTDLDDWLELNNRFHYALYESTSGPRLLSLIESLRNTAVPYVRSFIASSEHMKIGQASHWRILEACIARDATCAQREMEEHLDSVCKGVLKYMELQGKPS